MSRIKLSGTTTAGRTRRTAYSRSRIRPMLRPSRRPASPRPSSACQATRRSSNTNTRTAAGTPRQPLVAIVRRPTSKIQIKRRSGSDIIRRTRALPERLDWYIARIIDERALIDGIVHLIWALPAPALLVQREVIDEARSDRYRRRGRFGRDAGDGDGECPALSPLRRSSNLYVAALYPPKPRLGSPRGRSAHCSVFRSE